MSDKIKVAIKVRPRVPREENTAEHWKVVGNGIHLIPSEGGPSGEVYMFDHVFGKSATNFDVFESVVSPLVDRAVKGFNATIFAYGQTSSGKTHTMLGDNHEVGIIQLAVSSMFDFMTRSEGREFLVRASYMEIYNEKVNDLLDRQNVNLKIREDDGRIVVSRLKEELVADTGRVMNLLKRGQKIRRIGETNLNERSSRSHTIFRMIIESRLCDDGEDGTIQVSQLNLVDLAGSERAGLAGTTGDRLKEGCAINRSLFQLSQVVSQLSEGNQFVNFRDSKLTRILQPSLGGNAHTLIICTITPVSVEFTQSTLGFAQRAKSVKNKPLINEVMSDGTLLKKYARQLEKLQAELKAAKERNPSDELEAVECKLEEQERINSELQQRINTLMKSLIVSKPQPMLRPNRRRTWGGGKAFDLLKPRFSTLMSIPEDNLAPFDTSLVMETNDLNFNTPYEDFEVQLIEDEREKCDESFNIFRLDCSDTSNRISSASARNSLSPCNDIFKEEACVQTSPELSGMPKPSCDKTPTAVLYSRISALHKEWNELETFTRDEKNIMIELDNKLKIKEEECLKLQAKLNDKETILNSTLSLQESLTQKLIEYDAILEKNRKTLESCKNPQKIEELELQIEELRINTIESNEQIAAYRKKLYNEVISLNSNCRNEITENSEPSELLDALLSCIMDKEMEVMHQMQAEGKIVSHSPTKYVLREELVEKEKYCELMKTENENNNLLLHSELKKLQNTVTDLEAENSQLSTSLEGLRVEYDALSSQTENHFKNKKSLESLVQKLEMINEQLDSTNHGLRQEKDYYENRFHELETQLISEKSKSEEFSIQLLSLQSKLAEYEERLLHFKDTDLENRDHYDKQMETMEEMVKKLQEENKILQNEVQERKTEQLHAKVEKIIPILKRGEENTCVSSMESADWISKISHLKILEEVRVEHEAKLDQEINKNQELASQLENQCKTIMDQELLIADLKKIHDRLACDEHVNLHVNVGQVLQNESPNEKKAICINGATNIVQDESNYCSSTKLIDLETQFQKEKEKNIDLQDKLQKALCDIAVKESLLLQIQRINKKLESDLQGQVSTVELNSSMLFDIGRENSVKEYKENLNAELVRGSSDQFVLYNNDMPEEFSMMKVDDSNGMDETSLIVGYDPACDIQEECPDEHGSDNDQTNEDKSRNKDKFTESFVPLEHVKQEIKEAEAGGVQESVYHVDHKLSRELSKNVQKKDNFSQYEEESNSSCLADLQHQLHLGEEEVAYNKNLVKELEKQNLELSESISKYKEFKVKVDLLEREICSINEEKNILEDKLQKESNTQIDMTCKIEALTNMCKEQEQTTLMYSEKVTSLEIMVQKSKEEKLKIDKELESMLLQKKQLEDEQRKCQEEKETLCDKLQTLKSLHLQYSKTCVHSQNGEILNFGLKEKEDIKLANEFSGIISKSSQAVQTERIHENHSQDERKYEQLLEIVTFQEQQIHNFHEKIKAMESELHDDAMMKEDLQHQVEHLEKLKLDNELKLVEENEAKSVLLLKISYLENTIEAQENVNQLPAVGNPRQIVQDPTDINKTSNCMLNNDLIQLEPETESIIVSCQRKLELKQSLLVEVEQLRNKKEDLEKIINDLKNEECGLEKEICQKHENCEEKLFNLKIKYEEEMKKNELLQEQLIVLQYELSECKRQIQQIREHENEHECLEARNQTLITAENDKKNKIECLQTHVTETDAKAERSKEDKYLIEDSSHRDAENASYQENTCLNHNVSQANYLFKNQEHEMEEGKINLCEADSEYKVMLEREVERNQILESKCCELETSLSEQAELLKHLEESKIIQEKELIGGKCLELEKQKSLLEKRFCQEEKEFQMKIQDLENLICLLQDKLKDESQQKSDLQMEIIHFNKIINDKKNELNFVLEEAKRLEDQLCLDSEIKTELKHQVDNLHILKSECEFKLSEECKQKELLSLKFDEIQNAVSEQEKNLQCLKQSKIQLEKQLLIQDDYIDLKENFEKLQLLYDGECKKKENVVEHLSLIEAELNQSKLHTHELELQKSELLSHCEAVQDMVKTKERDLEILKCEMNERINEEIKEANDLRIELTRIQSLLNEKENQLLRNSEVTGSLKDEVLAFSKEKIALLEELDLLKKNKLDMALKLEDEIKGKQALQNKYQDLQRFKNEIQRDILDILGADASPLKQNAADDENSCSVQLFKTLKFEYNNIMKNKLVLDSNVQRLETDLSNIKAKYFDLQEENKLISQKLEKNGNVFEDYIKIKGSFEALQVQYAEECKKKENIEERMTSVEEELSRSKLLVQEFEINQSELLIRCDAVQEMIETKERDLEVLKTEMEDAIKNEKHIINELKIELEHLRTTCDEKEYQLLKYVEETQALKDQVLSISQEKSQLHHELESLKKEKSHIESQLGEETKEKHALLIKCQNIQKSQREVEAVILDILGPDIISMKQDTNDEDGFSSLELMKTLQFQFNSIVKSKQDIESNVQSMESELSEIKMKCFELQTDNELAKEKLTMEVELYAQIQNLEKMKHGLEDQLQSEVQEKNQLQNVLANLQQILNLQEEKSTTLTEKLQTLENEVRYYSVTHAEMEKCLEKVRNEKLESEMKVEEMLKEKENLLIKIGNLENRIVMQESTSEELDRAKLDFARMMESVKDKVPMEEYNVLKMQLDNQLKINLSLESEINYLQQIVNRTGMDQEQKFSVKDQSESIIKENGSLNKENESIYRECESLNKGSEIVNKENKVIRTESKEINMQGERMTVEGERMTVEGERMTVEGERMTVEGERMTVEGERMSVEGESTNKVSESMEELVSSLQKTCEEKENQIKHLLNERELLTSEISRLQIINHEKDKSVMLLERDRHKSDDQSGINDESLNVSFQNIKRQLHEEIKIKTELEKKLQIVQNELTEAKHLQQQLSRSQTFEVDKSMASAIADITMKLTEKTNEIHAINFALKHLVHFFPNVTVPHQTSIQKLHCIIDHIQEQKSPWNKEKEILENKITSLQGSVHSLQETLKKEGYVYDAPYWVRTGKWALSNRKMKQLERRVHELEQELAELHANNPNESYINDTFAAAGLDTSPVKSEECTECKALLKQQETLKRENAAQKLRITSLSSRLDSRDGQFKKKTDHMEETIHTLKLENKQLQETLSVLQENVRKHQVSKYNQSTQTEATFTSWDHIRALGSGSKIVNDHMTEVQTQKILRLEKDNDKLKNLVLDLRKRLSLQEKGFEKTSSSKSPPLVSSPRRRAALDRLAREAAHSADDRRQPWPCSWKQGEKENSLVPISAKQDDVYKSPMKRHLRSSNK